VRKTKSAKSRSRQPAAIAEAIRETGETVALQRRLRKSVAELQRLDPDAELLKEFPKLNARALRGLRKMRSHTEEFLRQVNITKAQRREATEQLHLIALVESEFVSGVDAAH
jgi:hypothetical protein